MKGGERLVVSDMQTQPKQSTSDQGYETTNRSFDIPQPSEVTAYAALQERRRQDELLRRELSDIAYAQAASNEATFVGDDRVEAPYLSPVKGELSNNNAYTHEIDVRPEDLAWVGAAARNLAEVRRQVILRGDYSLGA